MSDLATNRQIDDLRSNLTDKLEELHRRAKVAREMLTPSSYWKSPWLKVGVGVGAAALVGAALAGRTRSTNAPETLLHAAARSALMAAVGALVARGVRAVIDSDV